MIDCFVSISEKAIANTMPHIGLQRLFLICILYELGID